MRINDVGYNYFHNADFRVERPSGSGDFLLVLLKSPAVVVLEGKEVTVETNSFILFDKATPQIYRANEMSSLTTVYTLICRTAKQSGSAGSAYPLTV